MPSERYNLRSRSKRTNQDATPNVVTKMVSQPCNWCEVVAAAPTRRFIRDLHCCTCDEFFTGADIYNLHILLRHLWTGKDPPSASFTCLDCRTDFFDEKGFKKHLVEHDEIRRKADACARKAALSKKRKEEKEERRKELEGMTEEERKKREEEKKKRKEKKKKIKEAKKAERREEKKKLKKERKEEKEKMKKEKGEEKGKKIKIFICPDCNRDFRSKSLRRNHQCPNQHRCLSDECMRTFRTARGLVDHLESGACKSGYNRENISRAICERDTKSMITVPGILKLLEEHQWSTAELDATESGLEDGIESCSLSSWGVLTPVDGSEVSFELISNDGRQQDDADHDIISLASDYSDITPGSQESSIIISEPVKPTECHICHKVFARVTDLGRHLASPIHGPKLYHCQLSFMGFEQKGPVKQFKTLSGLVAHIESSGCRGGVPTFNLAMSMLGRLAEELGFPNRYSRWKYSVFPAI
ncbi:hypothetical protein TWF506_005961 [Arthrobotrys conoides]|uniref:C2H2-type domain-containing protein n=1 Tax=Arthrobotrys conoides TaxID=74498 RepID=A0AAN8NKN6_9PEZI